MQLKFQTVFRGSLLLFAGLLLWSVWAAAQQPATNTPAALAANVAEAIASGLAELKQDYLTFGLNRVRLDSVDGTVETIGFRSTRVRNLDGHLVTIPNKTMGNATLTNISLRPNIKTVMNIGVTYDTP